MKQVNMRELGRLNAKQLQAEPFEVIFHKEVIGRFVPAGQPITPGRKHDFAAVFRKHHGCSEGREKFKAAELGA